MGWKKYSILVFMLLVGTGTILTGIVTGQLRFSEGLNMFLTLSGIVGGTFTIMAAYHGYRSYRFRKGSGESSGEIYED